VVARSRVGTLALHALRAQSFTVPSPSHRRRSVEFGIPTQERGYEYGQDLRPTCSHAPAWGHSPGTLCVLAVSLCRHRRTDAGASNSAYPRRSVGTSITSTEGTEKHGYGETTCSHAPAWGHSPCTLCVPKVSLCRHRRTDAGASNSAYPRRSVGTSITSTEGTEKHGYGERTCSHAPAWGHSPCTLCVPKVSLCRHRRTDAGASNSAYPRRSVGTSITTSRLVRTLTRGNTRLARSRVPEVSLCRHRRTDAGASNSAYPRRSVGTSITICRLVPRLTLGDTRIARSACPRLRCAVSPGTLRLARFSTTRRGRRQRWRPLHTRSRRRSGIQRED
jgi:hypothetical protein